MAGYAPCHIFKWHGITKLPINRSFKWGWYWSLKPALIIVFLASFINEVIDDPVFNNEPFLDAWHHFALDILGMIVFLVFYYFFLRQNDKNA